ncbi:MAG: hypothetical protein SFU55_00215 [Methylophilus sp.]|nr:hypothetical protein [Methylophilus sp.]
MFRNFVIALFLVSLVGCGKYVTREGMTKLNNRFENAKSQLEQKAQAGQITWVQAETRIRDMDKEVKVKLDASGASHTWRYDSGDDEYYAYCIALAEKLDKNEITFAQFDAAKKRAFNQVEARRQGLENQQELIESSQRIEQSLKQKENTQQPLNNSLTNQCLYNPATQAYQVCYHVTAGGQCAHFGSPCN